MSRASFLRSLAATAWIASPLAAARLQQVPLFQGTPKGVPHAAQSGVESGFSRMRTAADLDRDGIVGKYCVTCHNEKLKTGELALDVIARGSVRDHAPIWEDVLHKLRAGSMPPPGMPRPEKTAIDRLMASLATELDAAPRDPGRPLLRRLNRAEYGNVIRDLLDLEVDVRSLLPADDAAFGFDNIADLQATSPSLLERQVEKRSDEIDDPDPLQHAHDP